MYILPNNKREGAFDLLPIFLQLTRFYIGLRHGVECCSYSPLTEIHAHFTLTLTLTLTGVTANTPSHCWWGETQRLSLSLPLHT